MLDPEAITKLQDLFGHTFADEQLLVRALTHTSYANEHAEVDGHNERLEFLGDAVLDLALSQWLMEEFPQRSEGVLSKMRASAVNESRLAKLARSLGLGEFLLLGNGEERTGGRDKDSVLADAYEACLGAIFKDGGYAKAAETVRKHFDEMIEGLSHHSDKDFKTRLQELTQAKLKLMPSYELISESGPDHDKTFEVELRVDGVVRGVGTGKSKKEAEQNAAREALQSLEAQS